VGTLSNQQRYWREYVIGWLSTAILFLIFTALGSPLVAAFIVILLVGIPFAAWYFLVERISGTILWHFFAKRLLHRSLPRTIRDSIPRADYTLGEPSFPQTIWSRFAQVVLSVFFLASLSVEYLPFLSARTPYNELGQFIVYGIVYLSLFAPLLILIWVYEDLGLRSYNVELRTLAPVGITLTRVVASIGGLVTFGRFVASLNTGPVQTFAIVFDLFLVMSPPSLLLTAIFHRKRERKLVSMLMNSRAAGRIGRIAIRLDWPDEGS